ncbi:MAG TPA: hypothetical protein VFC78_10190 [Tepidisphaeraceae bacterium]|nr:hypothetical protein [Tepidisphaeraceae bacterium]
MIVRVIRPLVLLACLAAILSGAPPIPAQNVKPQAADAPDEKPQLVTRLYDVRGLITPTPQFTLDASAHGLGFIAPANRQVGSLNPYGPNLFTVREVTPDQSPTRGTLLASLETLVRSVDAESWNEAGGQIGALAEMDGQLVITQTIENHKRIGELLQQLTDSQDQYLRTTADWVVVGQGDVVGLLKHAKSKKADQGGLREVDMSVLNKLPPATPRFHGELLSRNGQTVHLISGRERTVTANVNAMVGTGVAAFDPMVANFGSGIALQVNPLIDCSHEKATLTIHSTYNDPAEPGPPIPVHAGAATQPTTAGPNSSDVAAASYRTIDGIVQELRTTVQLPLGAAVLVGDMTLHPIAKGGDLRELLLIVTVNEQK